MFLLLQHRGQNYWLLIGWERGHFFLIFFRTRAKLLIPDWPSAKNTRIWLAKRESTPFAFCKRLETKSRFWIGFCVVQHKNIVSEFKYNRVGWQKWYGNRVIVRREIPEGEGEPERFTGNSKWLFVQNYQKPWLIQRARGCLATQVSLNKFKLT